MREKSKSAFQLRVRAAIALGAASLALALNFALGNPLFKLLSGGGVNAATRAAPARPAVPVKRRSVERVPKSKGKTQDEFAEYNPALNLDELQNILSRPAPRLARTPFELEPAPQLIQPVVQEAPPPPPPPPPPPTPPPPPIMLKVVGYSERIKEAYICESRADGSCTDDKAVYVVHEGEEFGNRYKAVRLTPQQVEVEDHTTHQTAPLPVPE
jgi:hypothetical protein